MPQILSIAGLGNGIFQIYEVKDPLKEPWWEASLTNNPKLDTRSGQMMLAVTPVTQTVSAQAQANFPFARLKLPQILKASIWTEIPWP